MALYQDGILISGANTLPKMTLAEYNALPADQRPTYWERLDGDYDDILADKTDIATKESGTTASKAYSVGELVYYNGLPLRRVKAPIASGATFTEGTNVEPTNVSGAVDGKVSKSGDIMSGNLQVDLENGTTTQIGESIIRIGNNKASGTAKNSRGILRTYGAGQYYGDLSPDSLTANRSAKLPNKDGTLAMTSDVPAISVGAITKSSVVTTVNSTVVKIGNLVIVQGAWYGGATNEQSIGQIAAGYRPSADLLCGGTVRYGSDTYDTYPCSYKIATDGTITQQQTIESAGSGCFFAAYVI